MTSITDIKIYREIDPLHSRNVRDEFKSLSNEEIKAKLKETSLPLAVMMFQLSGDFNFANVVRTANGFNAREVFYFGRRKYDRRGTVGTYHYTDVNYLTCFADLVELKKRYNFVALEQNSRSIKLPEFKWPKNKPNLIILGEEGNGLSEETINLCDYCIEIPMNGSVRSFNAASAAGIAMYDYVSKQ